MAEIQCPYCNLVSRISDGMPANCVRCGRQLPTGAALPQNVQYAQQPVPQTEQRFAAAPQMPAEHITRHSEPVLTLEIECNPRVDEALVEAFQEAYPKLTVEILDND